MQNKKGSFVFLQSSFFFSLLVGINFKYEFLEILGICLYIYLFGLGIGFVFI